MMTESTHQKVTIGSPGGGPGNGKVRRRLLAQESTVECICSLARLSIATLSLSIAFNQFLAWSVTTKMLAAGGPPDALVKLVSETQSSFGQALVAVTLASISGSAASGYASRRPRPDEPPPPV
jgi:hypothetical protein